MRRAHFSRSAPRSSRRWATSSWSSELSSSGAGCGGMVCWCESPSCSRVVIRILLIRRRSSMQEEAGDVRDRVVTPQRGLRAQDGHDQADERFRQPCARDVRADVARLLTALEQPPQRRGEGVAPARRPPGRPGCEPRRRTGRRPRRSARTARRTPSSGGTSSMRAAASPGMAPGDRQPHQLREQRLPVREVSIHGRPRDSGLPPPRRSCSPARRARPRPLPRPRGSRPPPVVGVLASEPAQTCPSLDSVATGSS